MNGRPFRPRGPIAPHPDLARNDRAARWWPFWFALAGFVLFAAIVGGYRAWAEILPADAAAARPHSP